MSEITMYEEVEKRVFAVHGQQVLIDSRRHGWNNQEPCLDIFV
jgi:hypothetical protein